jgi:hypothetical protein
VRSVVSWRHNHGMVGRVASVGRVEVATGRRSVS